MKKLFLASLLAVITCLSAMAVEVNSVAGLKAAVETPNAEILLTKKITWKVSDGDLDLNGATIDCNAASKFGITFTGTGELTWSNGTFTNNTSTVYALTCPASGLVLNLNNITIDNTVKYGVSVKANTLNVDEDCEFISSSRAIVVASGSVINNYGKISRIYGANTADGVTIDNHGTITWNTTFSAVNVEITNNAGASITISSTAAGSYEISNAGTLAFTGGTQAGTFVIANDGTLTMSGSSSAKRTGSFTVTNHGTYNISGGAQSGTFNIESDGTLAMTAGTHSGTFEIKNDGTFTLTGKTFSGSFDITNSQALTLTNLTFSGEFHYTNSGELNLRGGKYTGAASITNSGEVHLYTYVSGKTKYVPTFGSTLDITNNGTFTIDNISAKEGVVSFNGSQNTTINGGTFAAAPDGSAGYIAPTGEVDCYFAEGVGSLSVAAGYAWRSFDKLVTETSAAVKIFHANGTTETAILEQAVAEAQNKDSIVLLGDVKTFAPLFIGTESVDGTPISLTINLNGKTLTSAPAFRFTFVLTHGALRVVNSISGKGGIYNTYPAVGETGGEVFRLHGSYLKNCNPRTQTPFVHLFVDKDVDVHADEDFGNGITISEMYSSSPFVKDHLDYQTNVYATTASGQPGVANGVRVDVKGNIYAQKYSVKVNGQVRFPDVDKYGVGTSAETYRESVDYMKGYTVAIGDTAYSPYIHIYSTATLEAASDESSAVAVYSSGYGRWLIEGTCLGATGVYVKSGDVNLNDATVQSTYTGSAYINTGKGSGVDAYGSAVVIETNASYSGEQSLAVNGDTQISTEAEGGTALLDVVDGKVDESAVDNITLNGGSFSGDNAIVISEKTAESDEADVTVNGGVAFVGETKVADETGNEALNTIVDPETTHTATIENADGTQTVIIVSGPKPGEYTWTEILALDPGSRASWTEKGVANAKIIGDGVEEKVLQLGVFEMNAGTGPEDANIQQLTIKEKATLEVDKLILNPYARIIVEAGGKLVVKGEEGISQDNNPQSANNILLQTSATKHATLLIHPENVKSGSHPRGTIEFQTFAYYKSASDNQWERFGIPTWKTVENIFIEEAGKSAYLRSWKNNTWNNLGYLIEGTPFASISELNNSFGIFNLMSYKDEPGLKIKIAGEFTGKENADLTTNVASWNGYANSYTADLDIEAFLAGLAEAANFEEAIWLFKYVGNGTYVADPLDLEWVAGEKLAPMQTFILKNTGGDAAATLNYKNMVWDPAMGGGSPAPRRAISDNTAKLRIVVENEEGIQDNLKMSESMTNSHNVEKYLNEDMNLYASIDNEQMAIVAAENLEDTYVGFSTVKGGNFTISFTNVQGRQFDLIDLDANVKVAVEEGVTYSFNAPANTVADYRFKLTEREAVVTGVDAVGAEKSVKGVYTILGQYVGEMNVWNSLPAGVYVVNGEKRVK